MYFRSHVVRDTFIVGSVKVSLQRKTRTIETLGIFSFSDAVLNHLPTGTVPNIDKAVKKHLQNAAKRKQNGAPPTPAPAPTSA